MKYHGMRSAASSSRLVLLQVVLVVTAPPPLALAPQQGLLVAALGSAVEQLVEGVEDVRPAPVGRVDVVDGPVLERERAQPVALVAGLVLPAEVVLGAVGLLLVGVRDAEVV